MTRILCAQLAPRIGDLAANRELTVEAIRRGVTDGAEVIVLPELVASGYVFDSRQEAASLAITSAHGLFADWASAAGSAVVFGASLCQVDLGIWLYGCWWRVREVTGPKSWRAGC